MSKHTQGPWYAEFKYNRSRDAREWRIGPAVLDEDGNAMVTKFVAFVPYCCGPEQQPNARLIAAAPELFEILDALLGFDSAASYRARTRGYQLIQELKKANK